MGLAIAVRQTQARGTNDTPLLATKKEMGDGWLVRQPASVDKAPATSVKKPAETVKSWADCTFGTLARSRKPGEGDNIVTLPAGAKAGIVTATHSSSNFSLSVLAASSTPRWVKRWWKRLAQTTTRPAA